MPRTSAQTVSTRRHAAASLAPTAEELAAARANALRQARVPITASRIHALQCNHDRQAAEEGVDLERTTSTTGFKCVFTNGSRFIARVQAHPTRIFDCICNQAGTRPVNHLQISERMVKLGEHSTAEEAPSLHTPSTPSIHARTHTHTAAGAAQAALAYARFRGNARNRPTVADVARWSTQPQSMSASGSALAPMPTRAVTAKVPTHSQQQKQQKRQQAAEALRQAAAEGLTLERTGASGFKGAPSETQTPDLPARAPPAQLRIDSPPLAGRPTALPPDDSAPSIGTLARRRQTTLARLTPPKRRPWLWHARRLRRWLRF